MGTEVWGLCILVAVNTLMPGDPMIMGETISKGWKRTSKNGILGAKEGKYGKIVGTQQHQMLESNM